MWKLYKFFFYRLYKLPSYAHKDDVTRAHIVCSVMTAQVIFITTTLLVIYENILKTFLLSGEFIISIGIICAILNMILFLPKKKFRKVVRYYEKRNTDTEDQELNKRYLTYFILFIILIVWIIVGAVGLNRHKIRNDKINSQEHIFNTNE